MKFSLLYEMETPRPWNATSEYNVYWEALAQIELADRLGFDYVWEVEHHFLEEYSHSSAPEVFLGAVSQRTRNIRIGHGVRLLPFQFNPPIKLAEQAAVLDIMSNGRLEFGIGRSTTSAELDGFSVDYGRTRDEVKEALEIVLKAWQNEYLEHDGPLLKIPRRCVIPKPIQRPHPPLWMACVAPDSYVMAGERGLGVLSFALNFGAIIEYLASYKKAIANPRTPVSRLVNDHFAALAVVHVCETKEEEAIGMDGARFFLEQVANLFTPLMAKSSAHSYEYLKELFDLRAMPRDLKDEHLKLHPMVMVGTPDEVVAKLEAAQKAGFDQVICFKQAGRIPHRNIMRSLERMAKYVLPYFNPHRTVAPLPLRPQ